MLSNLVGGFQGAFGLPEKAKGKPGCLTVGQNPLIQMRGLGLNVIGVNLDFV